MTITPGSSAATCDVCDRPASATWHGVRAIYVCRECAEQVLPALAADALPYTEPPHLDGALQRMIASFWRAVAYRIGRKASGGEGDA